MGIRPAPQNVGTPPAGDQANLVWGSGLNSQPTFNAPGTTNPIEMFGNFNISIWANGGPNGAWTGNIRVERSFDGGTTWIVKGSGTTGTQMVFTSGVDVSIETGEPELGVLYRLNFTALSAGTLNWRFSTTGVAAKSMALSSTLP